MSETHAGVRRSVRGRRWTLFGGLAAAIVVVDQITKSVVDARFGLAWTRSPVPGFDAPTPVIGDLVRIAKSYNEGGIFGLFGDAAPVLALGSIAVIALIVVYQARQGVASSILTLALGLLLGGAVGNLIDRLRSGHVVDFVDMGIGTFRWYTFNVADAAISTAIVLLLAISFLGDRRASHDARTEPREETAERTAARGAPSTASPDPAGGRASR